MMPSSEAPLDATARELGRLLDSVFAGLERLRADADAIFSTGGATRSSLSALRAPAEHFIVEHGDLVDGAGIAVAPGVLADSETWLQWWRRDSTGGVSFAPHSFNPVSMNYYDYTSMPWFQRCAQSGRPVLSGPYIDQGGTDLKVITASVALEHGEPGRSVIATDLSLDVIESTFLRALGRRTQKIALVTDTGKVVASNTARFATGTLLHAGREAGSPQGLRGTDVPCASLPDGSWRLVVAE